MRGVPGDQLLGGPRGHPDRGTLERPPLPRSQLCGSHSSSFSSLLSSESEKERGGGRNRKRRGKEDRYKVVQRVKGGEREGERERERKHRERERRKVLSGTEAEKWRENGGERNRERKQRQDSNPLECHRQHKQS